MGENPGKSRRKTRKRQSDTVKKYTIINGQDKIGGGGVESLSEHLVRLLC